MLRFCGSQFRVAIRAHRLIDQRTGKMIYMADQSPCILLHGALCHGDFMQFCPRLEYVFWREAWLKKVPVTESGKDNMAVLTERTPIAASYSH
jgi:hypothetical protein